MTEIKEIKLQRCWSCREFKEKLYQENRCEDCLALTFRAKFQPLINGLPREVPVEAVAS